MKKIVSLALATLAICGASSVNAQEVTYVEDCQLGQMFNPAKDNWFITAQGGANVLVSKHDVKTNDFGQRIGADAALYVGKWVTPNFGFRFGASWVMPKGATTMGARYWKQNATTPFKSGYYPEKFMGIGPEFDILINLTNWWCGYRPGRVYNAVLHGGAGAYWTQYRGYNANGKNLHWRNAHNTILFANVGLQNNFRVAKHLDIFIDVTAQLIDFNDANGLFSLNAGLTYNFGKTEWNCPIVAICPTWKYTDAEGDALTARLAQAENKIRQLQNELDACLKRPVQVKEADCEGLATVYYPINQYGLSSREKTILRSVAEVMKNNPDKKYKLTGWADNYTGTEEINVRLRNQRVDGVYNFLVGCGVNPDQLSKNIDNNNLTDFGAKAAPLDRAVTIRDI